MNYYRKPHGEKLKWKEKQLIFYTCYLNHLTRFISEVEHLTQLEDENSIKDLEILEIRYFKLKKRMFREVLRGFGES